MKAIISSLKDWPTTKAGEPIFQCSEDGNFYANLISKNEKEIKIIREAYSNRRKQVKAMRDNGSEDFNTLYRLACQGQFYRECLDEVDRIHNNKFSA